LGKKSAPAAPDYTAAAEKTGQSNQAAQTRADWANRPTINTPWGQESWFARAGLDPSTGERVTNWTQNTKLNPLAQSTLDSTMQVDRDKAKLALGQMGRAEDAMSSPFDWNNLQGWGAVPKAGNLQAWNGPSANKITGGQGIQSGLDTSKLSAIPRGGQGIQSGLDTSKLSAIPRGGQGIQSGLDTPALGAMPQADAQERQRIENMMFERMAPQHQQSQAQLEGKLSNMGLTRGSEAWNREMQRMGDQQSRERFNAMETGGNEMQRLFGMQMQGRQQGWEELLGSGEFANRAQAQGFGQQMQGRQQGWDELLGSGEFANRAQAQGFGQQMQGRQQGWDELLGSGQFANQAQNQRFGQEAQASDQNFGQNRQRYMDSFNQRQQAGAQNFDQQQRAANYANALRQGQVAEQQQQRSMPLNELNALLSGTQVGQFQTPNFNPSQPAGGVNYSGAAGNQYNASMDQYNAKQSQLQGMMSGLSGLVNSGMMFSDRRLKSNIVRVGTHLIGVGVYEYDIFGRRERGVMAQEMLTVDPSRVALHPSGYYMVNYKGL